MYLNTYLNMYNFIRHSITRRRINNSMMVSRLLAAGRYVVANRHHSLTRRVGPQTGSHKFYLYILGQQFVHPI